MVAVRVGRIKLGSQGPEEMSVGEGCVGNIVIAKYNATKMRMSCHLGLWKLKGFRSS